MVRDVLHHPRVQYCGLFNVSSLICCQEDFLTLAHIKMFLEACGSNVKLGNGRQ